MADERIHETAFLQKPVVMDGSEFSFPDRKDSPLGSYREVLFRMRPLFPGVVATLVFSGSTPPDGAFGGVDEDIPDFGVFRQDFCQSDSVGSRNQSVFFSAETSGGKRSSTQT